MITLRHENDVWTAAADFDLQISGGVVDVLRFDLPPQCAAPVEVAAGMSVELVDVPGENRRQLAMRPAEPLAGEQRFRLNFPINIAAGQRLQVPDIRLIGVGRLPRFVLLPTRSNEQQLSWETRGLNVEPLPGGFSSGSSRVELYRTCVVVGDTFEARLKSVEKLGERPRAALADIRLICNDDQSCYGTASFDVEPAGTIEFQVSMPPAADLLQISVNGQPAVYRKIAMNRWLASGAAGKLPQRIDVTYKLTIGDPAEPDVYLLQAPVLNGFSVDQTIWTVYGRRWSLARPEHGVRAMSPLACAVVRLQTVSRLLESAAAALSQESADDSASAYSPWARRLLAARAVVERERTRAQSTESSLAAEAEVRAVDETQAKVARKLKTWNQFTELAERRSAAEGTGEIWDDLHRGSPSAVFAVAGPSAVLSLASPKQSSGELLGRLLAVLSAVAAIVAVDWVGRRGDVKEFLARWPQLLGVLFGLAWWLWLSPSLLGWLIVAVSVVDVLRRQGSLVRVRPREWTKSVVTSEALAYPNGFGHLSVSQLFGP